MTDILSIEPQKLEASCNKLLRAFVCKLNQHTNTLRKHSSELNSIADDLATKTQLLLRIEKIKPEDLMCYSVEQRDRVQSQIVSHANAQVIAANRLVQELQLLQAELKTDYQNLMASANSLLISTTNLPIIDGNCKQKPITFYLDEACRILYVWNLYQKSLEATLHRIEIRNEETIQQFRNVITLPLELSSHLDKYLLYSTFLFSTK